MKRTFGTARVIRMALGAFLLAIIFVHLGGYLLPADEARQDRTSAGAAAFEGLARGFPALRDLEGTTLADGDFSQWIDDERLHVQVTYEFGGGRVIRETAVLRQRPELIQERWSFREVRDDALYRQFEVDFVSAVATARKRDEDETDLQEWSADVDVDPGRTFAGFGFVLAIKALRERLVEGDVVELQAIGFTPQPRVASVEISYGGLEEMLMADRTLRGSRFVIHPRIPWIARLFVTIPDTLIWFTHPTPAGFLRWEGPLGEPDDPIVRVDLLPGGKSGPARPAHASRR